MDLVQAQITRGLGNPLCRCQRPPTPMVLVRVQRYQGPRGNMLRRYVFQCPRCEKTFPRGTNLTDRRAVLASD